MAEILGLGVTHSPLLLGTDARMAGITEHMQQSPRLPDHIRTPSGWPAPMRHVNCYGSSTISQTGAFAHIEGSGEEIPDPPGPTAARCFGIGAATARALAA